MSENSTLISYSGKITREELAQVPTPPATETHQPIAHHRVVEALVESMSFRHIGVVAEEYAVSKDGMRMFGVLDLEAGFEGCRFAIGLRNSHDKSFRLSCTVGVRVFLAVSPTSPILVGVNTIIHPILVEELLSRRSNSAGWGHHRGSGQFSRSDRSRHASRLAVA